MKLLVVNANTSSGVTEIVAREARRVAAPGTEIVAVTGAFGARIVTTRAENALAQHALLEALAEHHVGCDAALIAVSFDTGLAAARELLPIPVVGMTEAAALTACTLGARFGLVAFGSAQMYRELIEGYGLASRLGTIRTIDMSAAEAARDPEALEARLAAAARAMAGADGVDVVILCGAAMGGMPRRIQHLVDLPVIDGIECGTRLAELLAALRPAKARAGSYAAPERRESAGLSAALAAMLARPQS